jgi:hypothetical protein
LEEYGPYIRTLAWQQFPRDITRPDLDVDDIVQNACIKLWRALQDDHIISIKGYIRSIVHSEIVDIARRHKFTLPLPVDEDGELYQGDVIITQGEGMRDPAYEVEQKEFVAGCLADTADEVIRLPSCQQRAMICSLKDRVDDLLLLIETYQAHGIDIETVHWPEEKDERQKYRASLTVARKKLRASLYPRIFCDD